MVKTTEDIQERAKRGIKLLMLRQIVLQILMFGGGIVLARVLEPAEFGLYAIATFLVGTLALFGDFGLAPSFIQRKEELTEYDLRVGFTLQQIITTVIVAIIFVVAPFLARLYPKSPPETVWLIRALAFSLYLTSWRAMSALQLERHLRYGPLAWIEVVTNLSYQATAVVLALLKFGVWSFIWAVLLSQFLAAILVYLAAPWPIRFGFDKKIAKEILAYGIPFQLQAVVNQMQHWVAPTLVAALIGPQAVGYLSWATANAKRPLALVDNVMRVAFPHFSRIQDDKKAVESVLTKYLTMLLMVAGFWFSVILIAGPYMVRWIYTEKWANAIPALIVCSAIVATDSIAWATGMTLNALGNVRFVTRYLFVRHLFIILTGILLVFLIGFNGVPIASLVIGVLMTPPLFIGFDKGAFKRILIPMAWIILPVIASIIVGGLSLKLPLSLVPYALTSAIVTSVVYVLVTLIICPMWVKNLMRSEAAKYFSSFGLKAKWLVKEQKV